MELPPLDYEHLVEMSFRHACALRGDSDQSWYRAFPPAYTATPSRGHSRQVHFSGVLDCLEMVIKIEDEGS